MYLHSNNIYISGILGWPEFTHRSWSVCCTFFNFFSCLSVSLVLFFFQSLALLPFTLIHLLGQRLKLKVTHLWLWPIHPIMRKLYRRMCLCVVCILVASIRAIEAAGNIGHDCVWVYL